MPSRLSSLIIAGMLFALPAAGFAREPGATEPYNWSYRAWQTDEGLPDNSVTGVVQTPDGYLWVATYGGLVRFNGANFSAIPLTGQLKKSVRNMLLDHRGRFWLGMDSGSVICVDSNISHTFTSIDGLSTERIEVMAEDHEGAIWAIYSSSLCRIKDGQVNRFTAAEGLPTGINAWVASDADGQLWFSKGGQLVVFRDGKLVPKLTFKETYIRICKSARPGVWICAGSRLLKYEENREPEERALLPENVEPQVLFEDRTGALWIGTAADGLFRFKNGSLEKVPTSHQSVNCLSEDREGNIWAGTRGGGLNLIQPSAVDLIGRDAGLPFEAVASVCEDSEGVIWAASQSGTLSCFRSGKWDAVGAAEGWIWDAATCVAADRKGGIWVGARDRTLHYFHDGAWRTWRQEDGLHSGSVHLIFVAANDDVWVVTGTPSRLQQLHDGKLLPALQMPDESRTIRAVAEGADGTIWIGTLEGQILRVQSSSLVIETAAVEPEKAPIRALETTADGALWIGYTGAGIGRLKDGKYSRVTTAAGLGDDFISQLLADGRGGLWVVASRGLFQVQLPELTTVAEGRKERLLSLVFGRSEGLPNFQPNSASFPNVCKAGDGRLWFATRSGLLTVQPENIRGNPVPPPVELERVSVDDKTVALYNGRSPLRTEDGSGWPDPRQSDTVLHIPPGHHKMEFEFSALSFTSPENVQFRYRLDDFDEKWIEAGTQRSAKYPRLPAGRYRFQVLACNNAGVWNESGAALTFVVSRFFWQTWWFRGLVLMTFTAAVVAIVRYVSFRRLRARMLRLEQQAALERERTRIARDMHDEVGAKLTRLSLLSEMAGVHPEMPAAARGEVKEISDTARETIRSFEEIVWAVNPRNDTLVDLVHYLCRYTEDYFEGSPVQCAFDLPPEIPPVVLLPEVRQHVFLAAKEALNNVLKHSNASRVQVQLALAAGEFKIIIEDNGCGFNADVPPRRTGGGNGLENMRERLRSIGGRLECQSQPGRGTRIIFNILGGASVAG